MAEVVSTSIVAAKAKKSKKNVDAMMAAAAPRGGGGNFGQPPPPRPQQFHPRQDRQDPRMMFQQQQQQQQPPPPQQQMDQGQSPPINFRVILNRDEVAFLFGFDGVLLGQLRQQGRDSHFYTWSPPIIRVLQFLPLRSVPTVVNKNNFCLGPVDVSMW